MVRLSTTQNMMDWRKSQTDESAPAGEEEQLHLRVETHVHDEGHDEHDQRQLQLRVSDVAQQHLLQLKSESNQVI